MAMLSVASNGKAPTKLVLGMMLLPLFMALVFPVMFLTAFHDPEPKDMNLTVIESTKKAEQIAHGLEVNSDGKLHVDTVADVQAGKDAVMNRDTRASYNPKTGDLYVAGGNGQTLTNVTKQIFTQVASQSDKQLKLHDLSPLAKNDIMGTGFIYMVMIGMMTGYMTALMLNMFGKGLGVWKQLAVLGGMAVAAAVIVTSTTYNVYEVYDHHMIYSMLIVAAMFITVSVFQLGLARLIGQASAFFGIIVFIILGMPTSGISMPVDMLAGFFRVLHKFHPLGAGGDLMRSNLYFHGEGIATDIIVLATWLLVGVGLLLMGMIKAPQTPDAAAAGGDQGGPDGPNAADSASTAGAVGSAAAADASVAAGGPTGTTPVGSPEPQQPANAAPSELQTQN